MGFAAASGAWIGTGFEDLSSGFLGRGAGKDVGPLGVRCSERVRIGGGDGVRSFLGVGCLCFLDGGGVRTRA